MINKVCLLFSCILMVSCALEVEKQPPYRSINGQYKVETYNAYPVFNYPKDYTCTINFPDIILHIDTDRPSFAQNTYIEGSPMECSAFRIDYDRMAIECHYTSWIPFFGLRWDQFLGINARTSPPYDALLTAHWDTALGAFLCTWNAEADVYLWEEVQADKGEEQE